MGPMRDATGPGTSPRTLLRRRTSMLALAAAAVVVGAVVAYMALQPGPPLRILSVAFSPDPGSPAQPLTVTAVVQGGTFLRPAAVSGTYLGFFAWAGAGGLGFRAAGGQSYSATIGPFSNGTALWIEVTASDGQTRQSVDSMVDVGEVIQGGPSGLRLSSVVLDPPQPTSLDMPRVYVNVSSSAEIAQVNLACLSTAGSGGRGSGVGGVSAMYPMSSGGYYIPFFGTFSASDTGSDTPGSFWVYRIAAADLTGNTVLSPVYNFTVRSP